MKWAVVFERADNGGWGGAAPDLPGLIATGATFDECRERMSSAIAFHLDELRSQGSPIPSPLARVAEIEATVPA